VYGETDDLLLLSLVYDDRAVEENFPPPNGTKVESYISGRDEAGFLYSKELAMEGDTGILNTTTVDIKYRCKDAMISLVVKNRTQTAAKYSTLEPTNEPTVQTSLEPSIHSIHKPTNTNIFIEPVIQIRFKPIINSTITIMNPSFSSILSTAPSRAPSLPSTTTGNKLFTIAEIVQSRSFASFSFHNSCQFKQHD